MTSSDANVTNCSAQLHVDSYNGNSNVTVSCTGPALTISVHGRDPVERHVFLPAYRQEIVEKEKTVIMWFRPPQISISADQDKRRIKFLINSETNRTKFCAEVDPKQVDRLKRERGSLENLRFSTTSGNERREYDIEFTGDKMIIRIKVGDDMLQVEELDIRSGNVTIDGCIKADLGLKDDAGSKSEGQTRPKDEKKQKKANNDKAAVQTPSEQHPKAAPAECVGIFQGMRLLRTMLVEWAPESKNEKLSPVVKFMQVFAFNQQSGGDTSAKQESTLQDDAQNQGGTDDKESGKQRKLSDRRQSQQSVQPDAPVASAWNPLSDDIFSSSDGQVTLEDSVSEEGQGSGAPDDMTSETSSVIGPSTNQEGENIQQLGDSHEHGPKQDEEIKKPVTSKDETGQETPLDADEKKTPPDAGEKETPPETSEGTGQMEPPSAADRETEGVKKITFTQVRGLHGEQAIRHSLVGFRTAYKIKKQQSNQPTSKGQTVKG